MRNVFLQAYDNGIPPGLYARRHNLCLASTHHWAASHARGLINGLPECEKQYLESRRERSYQAYIDQRVYHTHALRNLQARNLIPLGKPDTVPPEFTSNMAHVFMAAASGLLTCGRQIMSQAPVAGAGRVVQSQAAHNLLPPPPAHSSNCQPTVSVAATAAGSMASSGASFQSAANGRISTNQVRESWEQVGSACVALLSGIFFWISTILSGDIFSGSSTTDILAIIVLAQRHTLALWTGQGEYTIARIKSTHSCN